MGKVVVLARFLLHLTKDYPLLGFVEAGQLHGGDLPHHDREVQDSVFYGQIVRYESLIAAVFVHLADIADLSLESRQTEDLALQRLQLFEDLRRRDRPGTGDLKAFDHLVFDHLDDDLSSIFGNIRLHLYRVFRVV